MSKKNNFTENLLLVKTFKTTYQIHLAKIKHEAFNDERKFSNSYKDIVRLLLIAQDLAIEKGRWQEKLREDRL